MSYVRELRTLVGHRPLIIVGAAVLILDQKNRLLLHHRKDNQKWGLIGGSMEIGESLEETARREVFEGEHPTYATKYNYLDTETTYFPRFLCT